MSRKGWMMDVTLSLTSSEIWPPNVTHVPVEGMIKVWVKHSRHFACFRHFSRALIVTLTFWHWHVTNNPVLTTSQPNVRVAAGIFFLGLDLFMCWIFVWSQCKRDAVQDREPQKFLLNNEQRWNKQTYVLLREKLFLPLLCLQRAQHERSSCYTSYILLPVVIVHW